MIYIYSRFRDFNHDDEIYIEKLKRANQSGTTSVIIGTDGGHTFPITPFGSSM